MAFADTSSAKLALVKESTFGTSPGSGATFVRFTSDSLLQNTDIANSEEVTGDRNPRGAIRTAINAEGDINFEFSDNNFDTLLEGALASTFGTTTALTGQSIDINVPSADTTTRTPTPDFDLVDSSGTTATFADVVAGQWIRLDGFDTNGVIYARVAVKVDGSTVECEGAREDGTAVTAEAGQTDIAIDGAHLEIGSDKPSFTIERQWTDVNIFELFTGMTVGTASLEIAPGSLITGTFSFQGVKQAEDISSALSGTADAGTETIVNAVDNIEGVMEGGYSSHTGLDITELSFNIDNQLRNQNVIANLGPVGIGFGVAQVSGTLNAFLEDKTLIEKYLNQTESSLAFRIKDTDGNVTIFTFPQIKFTSGQDVISSNAADGIVELEWTAEKEDDASLSGFTIDRFGPV